MEIHFSSEIEAKLSRIAADNKYGAEAYVRELVEHYMDHDAWFRQQVKVGLEQLDRGETLSQDQVEAAVERMFRT